MECSREEALRRVKLRGKNLRNLSLEFRNDKVIVLEALKQNGASLQFGSDELRNDREFVLEAVKQNGKSLWCTNDELKNDKEVVLEAVKQHGSALGCASDELKNDKEVVLEAVKQHGSALGCASDELKNDKEVVLEGVKKYGLSLQFASDDLKNDKEVVLEGVKQDGWSLQYASDELKNEREIVFEAVKQGSHYLDHASEVLQDEVNFLIKSIGYEQFKQLRFADYDQVLEECRWKNKEYVLEKVKEDGSLLQKASSELKGDREVVTEAIKNSYSSFQYASQDLKKDKVFCLDITKHSGYFIYYADDSLKRDKAFMLQLAGHRASCLEYAANTLKNDKDFILRLFQMRKPSVEDVLQHISLSDDMKKDLEVLEFLPERWTNKIYVLSKVRKDGTLLDRAGDDLRKDEEVAFAAFNQELEALEYVHQDLRGNTMFMTKVVNQNPHGLEYCSDGLKDDKDVVLAAIRQDQSVLKFASQRVQKYFKENPQEIVKPAKNEEEEELEGEDNDDDELKSLVKEGKVDEKKEELLKKLETNPSNVENLLQLSDIYQYQKESIKTLEIVEKALSSLEKEIYSERVKQMKSQLIEKKTFACLKLGHIRESLSSVDEQIKMNRNKPKKKAESVFLRSQIRASYGDVKGSLRDLETLIHQKDVFGVEENAHFCEMKATLFKRDEKYDRAIEYFKKAKGFISQCKEVKGVFSGPELEKWKVRELSRLAGEIDICEKLKKQPLKRTLSGTKEIRIAFVCGNWKYSKDCMDGKSCLKTCMSIFPCGLDDCSRSSPCLINCTKESPCKAYWRAGDLKGCKVDFESVKKFVEEENFKERYFLHNFRKQDFDATFQRFLIRRNQVLREYPDCDLTLFFYFTGHGSYENYTVLELKKSEFIDIQRIKFQLRAVRTTNLYFLDCCRVFTDKTKIASRKQVMGVKELSISNNLISTSTEPGVCSFAISTGSYYTDVLLEHLKKRNWSIETLLKLVKNDLVKKTKHLESYNGVGYAQNPWYRSDLINDYIWNRTDDYDNSSPKAEIASLKKMLLELKLKLKDSEEKSKEKDEKLKEKDEMIKMLKEK